MNSDQVEGAKRVFKTIKEELKQSGIAGEYEMVLSKHDAEQLLMLIDHCSPPEADKYYKEEPLVCQMHWLMTTTFYINYYGESQEECDARLSCEEDHKRCVKETIEESLDKYCNCGVTLKLDQNDGVGGITYD